MTTRIRLRLGRIHAKYGVYIQTAIGLAVVGCCVGILVLAAEIRDQGQQTSRLSLENETRSTDTAAQSRLACQRTRRFGPQIADGYERLHILRGRELDAYRDTIPKVCPAPVQK